MLKKVFGRKFSRSRASREGLFRSLVRALVINGKIITSLPKAKAIQGKVDKIFSKVRKNTLAGRRLVLAELGNDKEVTNKLFGDYLELSKKRNSGMTRIIKLSARKGDNSARARIEFVDKLEPKTKPVKETKKTKEKKAVKVKVKNENKTT